jgi:hypothetical protein
MADDPRRVRYGEAFWRAHHEAWQRSDLNQRGGNVMDNIAVSYSLGSTCGKGQSLS